MTSIDTSFSARARSWLGAILFGATLATAHAGDVILPSDIAVTLAATPDMDLLPGQPVDMTLTAINLGIAPVDTLILRSSMFVDEMQVTSFNIDECYLVLTVLDGETSFAYLVSWGVAIPGFPNSPTLQPGESRSCHFRLALRPQAPPVFPFTFALSSRFSDPNPANDSATVTLRRRIAESVPIPALSPVNLLLLAVLLALAAFRARRGRKSADDVD